MAEFNLGLAQCKVRERAEGATADYLTYFRKNNINPLNEKDNQYVINYNELNNIYYNLAYDCQNENDTKKLQDKIAQLRALVK